MADEGEKELLSLLNMARKMQINFAVCMGKKPEGTVMLMHRKQGPDILFRKSKKSGETKKGAYGFANVEGSKLLLTCAEHPSPGLSKALKKYLKSVGKPLKITLLSETGEVLETDEQEELEGDVSAIPKGIVAKRAFLLTRWKQIPVDLKVEIFGLLKAVKELFPEEDIPGFAKAIQGTLKDMIDDMQGRVSDALDQSINDGDPKYSAVTAEIALLRSEVGSSEVILALAQNQLSPGKGFATAFLVALDEVEAALAA